MGLGEASDIPRFRAHRHGDLSGPAPGAKTPSNKTIHHDVKGNNILLTTEVGVKLLDFGNFCLTCMSLGCKMSSMI